jgi:diguanylate cyclase (GGDEF)-like protein
MPDSPAQTVWNTVVRNGIAAGIDDGEPTIIVDYQEGPATEIVAERAPVPIAAPSPPAASRGKRPTDAAPEADGSPKAAASARTAKRTGGVRWYLSSGVGRRLLTMFVLASLIPVALLAALSFFYVSSVLQERLDHELLLDARLFGSTVTDRLLWQEHELYDAAAAPKPLEQLAPRIGRELVGAVLLNRRGEPIATAGGPVPLPGFAPKSFDASNLRRRTALLIPDRSPSTPVIVAAIANRPDIGFIAAAIDGRKIWGDRDTEPGTDSVCLMSSTGSLVYCPPALASETAAELAGKATGGPALVEVAIDGRTTRVSAMRPAVNDRFLGNDLVVGATFSGSKLLQPMHWFQTMFLPAAGLSVLLVGLIGITQVRRILVPLRRLLYAMQRVARRDFATPVPVVTRDEFGMMAKSFNKMTAELGLHFRTLSAFSEIDRTILTTVDMRQVAEIALACIQEISGIKVVSLGLLEADSPGRTQVYLRAGAADTVRDELPRALDLSHADSSLRKWSKTIRLPANYRAMLHKHGAKYLYLLPIARADRVWGVVVLGHDQKTALSTEQALALAGVIDRLAVALSSVARDKQLHDQAHFDSLTGLPNRHFLMDMLTQQVKQARRDKAVLAVLYIDLDRFKRTNDTLGHAAGDVLLRQAAARIRAAVRDVDIVARLGGDEFTVVLTSLKDAASAGAVARTLINALNEPFEIDGHVMYAGGSIGISLFPKDGETAAELLKKADTALYLAKDRGRGRYAYFEERMNVDASARVTIDRELREALRHGEFVLHYQPQIDLATGEVCAVEALLRWMHPERGMLAPEHFIEHAEESGLIEGIGTWVMREACRQHRAWVEAGLVIPRVSVNVSAVQLRNPSFAAAVEGALTSSTTPPHYLELEVTESLLVDAGPDAVATLERLRERGVEIAVDDFGTGYSSFAYVKQLPANILKLDRTFIVDVVDNPQAAIIASAIMEMAGALGKIVVAEGVETPQQAQFLRRNHCARAQGFVFSAALPPEQIPAFVRERERDPDSVGKDRGLLLVHPKAALSAA